MGWDHGYRSPDEVDAERNAALEAQARAKLSQFERRQLDYLGEISATLAQLVATVGARQPASPVCPNCRAEQPIWPPRAYEIGEDGSVRLLPIELDDVDRSAAIAALEQASLHTADRTWWTAALDVAVRAINETRAASGDGGRASAEPVDETPDPRPGSARPDSTT